MIEVVVKCFSSSRSLAGGVFHLYNIFFILKETEEITECFKTPKVTRQLPLTKVKPTSKTQQNKLLECHKVTYLFL